MLNKRRFDIELNMLDVDKAPIMLGSVKQLDGTTINITPLNGHRLMSLKGCTAKLFAKKPNGVFVYQEDAIRINEDDSLIVIQCKNSIFSKVGTVQFEVEVFDDDGYTSTTPTLEIKVVEKLNQLADGDFMEANEIQILDKLKDYVKESSEFIERYKELLAELGEDDNTMLENLIVVREMVETLDQEIDNLDKKIEEARQIEISIANNEVSREAAEKLRVEAEAKREASFAKDFYNKAQIDKKLEGLESTYPGELNQTVTSSIGGFVEGDSLNGMSLAQILEKMLCAEKQEPIPEPLPSFLGIIDYKTIDEITSNDLEVLTVEKNTVEKPITTYHHSLGSMFNKSSIIAFPSSFGNIVGVVDGAGVSITGSYHWKTVMFNIPEHGEVEYVLGSTKNALMYTNNSVVKWSIE